MFCVIAGGCGGSDHTPISNSGGENPDVEALNNKTFESPTGATGTGTAKDSDGNDVDVTVSDLSVKLSNVTVSSFQAAATKGTVVVSYTLTIGGNSEPYSRTENNVDLSEESSGVYAFSFDNLSFTIDPTSGVFTIAGNFTFAGKEYTLADPITIGVSETTTPETPAIPDTPETPKTPVSPDTPVTTVNDIWNGGWVAMTGSPKIDLGNGVSLDASVKNISVFFESSDVEDTDGSTTMSALFYVAASNDLIKLPVLFDREIIATSRDETNEKVWEAKTNNNGDFNITLIDETHATFNGTFTFANAKISCNEIALTKPTTATDMGDISTKIKGTWQSDNDSDNGGFMLSPSLPMPLLGMGGYFNGVFSDNVLIYALMPTVIMNNGITTQGITVPIRVGGNLSDLNLEQIFGRIYRFETKGVIAFTDAEANKAIMAVNLNSSNLIAYSVFDLEKKTGSGDVNITTVVGSTWSARQGSGVLQSEAGMQNLVMSEEAPFSVNFISVDIANRSINLSADGTFFAVYFVDNVPQLMPFNFKEIIGTLSETGSVNDDGTVTLKGISNIGYNTWYATTEAGSTFLVAMKNENEGYIVVYLRVREGVFAFVVGSMTKQ